MKACAMCRKHVDSEALICPYCRSNTDYNYFVSVFAGELVKREHDVRAALAVVFCVGIGLMAAAMGIAAAGLLAGAGAGIFAGMIAFAITTKVLSTATQYLYMFRCSKCRVQDEVRFSAAAFDDGVPVQIQCPSCGCKTRVARGA